MQADIEDGDFVAGMKAMLGMDEDKVKDLIDKLNSSAMLALADAVANNDIASVEHIVGSVNTDEDVNPLFRGNIKDTARKKKHARKMDDNTEFIHGDDVYVEIIDPETGKKRHEDGTVYLPNGPDNTVGVKVQGKTVMVDRQKVRKLQENALDEGVLGMTNIPNLERMQQLAGIQPAGAQEIVVQGDMASDGPTDPCTAAQQAMAALDTVAAMLPKLTARRP